MTKRTLPLFAASLAALAAMSGSAHGAGNDTSSESSQRSPTVENTTESCGASLRAAGGTGWTKGRNLPCTIMGSPGHKVTYGVSNQHGPKCGVQVRGFKSGKRHWYSAGTGGDLTVPWGNNADAPAFRIKCGGGASEYWAQLA